jgi:hypothetical protein
MTCTASQARRQCITSQSVLCAAVCRLLAKHTLQGGMANQTAATNEELSRTNELLVKVIDSSGHCYRITGITLKQACMFTSRDHSIRFSLPCL